MKRLFCKWEESVYDKKKHGYTKTEKYGEILQFVSIAAPAVGEKSKCMAVIQSEPDSQLVWRNIKELTLCSPSGSPR